MAGIKAARPNVRMHFISPLFANTENWPDPIDANTSYVKNVTWKAIKAAVATEPQAEAIDIRSSVFGIDAPLYNPTHLTTGVLTQDGTHPTKPLGQLVISKRVWVLSSVGV